jgi:hypothetical protein
MTTTRLGEEKANPALVELRQQRILLTRLIVALRVPLGSEEGEDGHAASGDRRPQHRGVRGVYAVGGRS